VQRTHALWPVAVSCSAALAGSRAAQRSRVTYTNPMISIVCVVLLSHSLHLSTHHATPQHTTPNVHVFFLCAVCVGSDLFGELQRQHSVQSSQWVSDLQSLLAAAAGAVSQTEVEHTRSALHAWYHTPAATLVPWVVVDGLNLQGYALRCAATSCSFVLLCCCVVAASHFFLCVAVGVGQLDGAVAQVLCGAARTRATQCTPHRKRLLRLICSRHWGVCHFPVQTHSLTLVSHFQARSHAPFPLDLPSPRARAHWHVVHARRWLYMCARGSGASISLTLPRAELCTCINHTCQVQIKYACACVCATRCATAAFSCAPAHACAYAHAYVRAYVYDRLPAYHVYGVPRPVNFRAAHARPRSHRYRDRDRYRPHCTCLDQVPAAAHVHVHMHTQRSARLYASSRDSLSPNRE
jgi:hypothetical protein